MLFNSHFQNMSHFYTVFMAFAWSWEKIQDEHKEAELEVSGMGMGTEAVSGSTEDPRMDWERSQEIHIAITNGCAVGLFGQLFLLKTKK